MYFLAVGYCWLAASRMAAHMICHNTGTNLHFLSQTFEKNKRCWHSSSSQTAMSIYFSSFFNVLDPHLLLELFIFLNVSALLCVFGFKNVMLTISLAFYSGILIHFFYFSDHLYIPAVLTFNTPSLMACIA